MASFRCLSASQLIPAAWWILSPQPLQDLHVASPRCRFACPRTPGGAPSYQPLHQLQVAPARCRRACVHITGAAISPQPLHQHQQSSDCRLHHPGLSPRGNITHPVGQCGPPLQDPQGPGVGVSGVVVEQGLYGAEVKAPRPEKELALESLEKRHEPANKSPHLGTGKGQRVAAWRSG